MPQRVGQVVAGRLHQVRGRRGLRVLAHRYGQAHHAHQGVQLGALGRVMRAEVRGELVGGRVRVVQLVGDVAHVVPAHRPAGLAGGVEALGGVGEVQAAVIHPVGGVHG